jgi:hypothetical protein
MKKIYILTLITLFAAVGCKKSFLSQEVNPNIPSTASPQNVLSGVEESLTAYTDGNTYLYLGLWTGYFTPSGSFTPNTLAETYNFTNTSFSRFGAYSQLANLNYLIQQGAADPTLANFAAIGKILTAYTYQMLVDNYNDVPYTQALNSDKYLFPAYDKGQDIYNDLEKQLDAAIALINSSASATNPTSSDIIFSGNMTNWKKFANTLKLRIAIRQSNLTANFAGLKTEIAKTASEGYLDDVTFVTAQPGYIQSDANGGQQNPFYKNWGFTAAGAIRGAQSGDRANDFYVNFLVGLNDTLRLKQVYAPCNTLAEKAALAAGTIKALPTPPNNVDHIRGNILGSASTLQNNNYTSGIGPGLMGTATMPMYIITGAEACFLLSEGVMDGLVTSGTTGVGTAQDYYQRGITASFVQLAVPGAATAAKTYYSQAAVSYPGTNYDANLQAIITQKYIALIGYGFFETYNEYRRTGYPNLDAARSKNPSALGTGPVPTRIFFPSTEFQQNAAAVGAEPVVNVFTSKIFWAK